MAEQAAPDGAAPPDAAPIRVVGGATPQPYDVVFVADATGSMGAFLDSLARTLPQLVQLSRLYRFVGRVAVLAYRDYDCAPCGAGGACGGLVEWSGWHGADDAGGMDAVAAFAAKLRAGGGGDFPEAARTAAVHLATLCARPTLAVWYTDAPPHHARASSDPRHLAAERAALGDRFDWVALCRALARARVAVFPMLSTASSAVACFYALAAAATGGACLALRSTRAPDIARCTVGLFLALCGHGHDFGADADEVTLPGLRAVEGGFGALADEAAAWAEGAQLLPFGPVAEGPVGGARLALPGFAGGGGGRLEARYAEDAAFRETVHDVLERVLRPGAVEAITYNAAFGALWRAVCRARDCPRRQRLVDLMGAAVSGVAEEGGARAAVRGFLEASYDRTAEVQEELAAVPEGARYPALVCDEAGAVTRQELLELGRSCAAPVLARAARLLAGLRVVEAGPLPPGAHVPLSLPAERVFALLPHLLAEGAVFSRRPAAVTALLAAASCAPGQPLRAKALELLEELRGRWIDPAAPESLAPEFVRLVLRVPEALTDAERARFEHLRRLAGLAANAATTLEARTGYTSHKTSRPDAKPPCARCARPRSFTLLSPEGVCGVCEDGEVAPEGCDERPDASCWCECRGCGAHYAVARPHLLNVAPKCHYCRAPSLGPPPTAECRLCRNRFLCRLPAPPGAEADGQGRRAFVCPPCAAAGAPVTEARAATVREYVEENGAGCVGVDAPPGPAAAALFGRSLYRLCADGDAPRACEPVAAGGDHTGATLGGRAVLDRAEVEAALRGWVESGRAEEGACALCCEGVRKSALLPACGRTARACGAAACRACLDAWYGQARPGALCYAAHLLCPFCKRPPAAKALMRHNRAACLLKGRGAAALAALDPTQHHAWCRACYELRPAAPRACGGGGDLPAIAGFVCRRCAADHAAGACGAEQSAGAQQAPLDRAMPQHPAASSGSPLRVVGGATPATPARFCPACGVATEKTSGCDHIACPCGAHWCWRCSAASETEDGVYRHMMRAHGGFFGGDGGDGYSTDGSGGYGSGGYGSDGYGSGM